MRRKTECLFLVCVCVGFFCFVFFCCCCCCLFVCCFFFFWGGGVTYDLHFLRVCDDYDDDSNNDGGQ